MNEGKYKRVSQIVALALIGFSFAMDIGEVAVDWIPGVGQILAYVFDITGAAVPFAFFLLKGVKFTRKNRLAKFGLPTLVEMLPIPLFDILGTTLATTLTIFDIWKEDEEAAKQKKLADDNQKPGVVRPQTGGTNPNPNVIRQKKS